MKRSHYLSYFFIGLAAACLSITNMRIMNDILLYFFPSITSFIKSILISSSIGLSISLILFAAQNYLVDNWCFSLKQFSIAILSGIFAGGFSRFLINLSINEFSFQQQIIIQPWFLLATLLYWFYAITEKQNLIIYRTLLIGLTTEIITHVITLIITYLLANTSYLFEINLITFSIIFFLIIHYSTNFKRKNWIRILNGPLIGQEFELTKPLYTIGAQQSSNINFDQYYAVDSSHAKFIKYDQEYTLFDNIPIGNTYVNFRKINEYLLKNGDIIKLGNILLQYCTAK